MGARFPSIKPVLAALLLGLAATPAIAQDDERVARLFEELQAAGPAQTDGLSAEIREAWSRSGSPAIDLLLTRGREALGMGDVEAAVEHLTAAIDHTPGLAEAHVLRANAYYLDGLTGPAIDDLRVALAIEPRHFGALEGFAALLEEMGRPEAAREVWGRVLALKPQDAQAGEAAHRLDIMLGGRTL
ncbi:tetratricopeptide repeat protein [Limimaricola variabilis]|uniref:tetratricopeptide repeat protein n=1 Tax=Limimaricola variabilis TaxID=1492771 RepID=UPI001FE37913|nr:tetratricopeptide repeat protein [Limimaricola variabilis]